MQNVHFSPKQIARMVGVNESTVKRWVDADLLPAVKTPGGHRRVREEDLRAFMARGKAPAVERSYTFARFTRQTCTEAWRRYYDLHKQGDHTAARHYVTGFLLSHGTARKTVACVIAPALVEIGAAWHRGELDIADEHRMSFRIRGDVYALDGLLPAPTPSTPRVVLACVPEENHEIALGLVGLAAHEAGWEPVVLGINVPKEEIVRSVTQSPNVRAVALTKIFANARDTRAYIEELSAHPALKQIPILLGGTGWSADERAAFSGLPNVSFCASTDAFTAALSGTR